MISGTFDMDLMDKSGQEIAAALRKRLPSPTTRVRLKGASFPEWKSLTMISGPIPAGSPNVITINGSFFNRLTHFKSIRCEEQ